MDELYIVVHSGLCNKLLPLMSLLRISELNKKNIVCYWTNECMSLKKIQNGYHFLDFFEELHNVKFIDEKEFNIIKDKLSKNKNIHKNLKENIYINDENSIYNENTLIYNKITHIISFLDDKVNHIFNPNPKDTIYIENHIDFITNLRKYLKHLKPLDDIQQKINYFINENNFNQNILGIHIRSVDGGFKYFNTENSIKYIEKIIHNSPEWKIFISTDNIEIETKIKNIFKEKIIYFNNPFGNNYSDKFNFNSYNGLKNSICDLFILSKCNKIIGTKSSSFSLMAFLLSNNDILEYW